MTDLLKDVGTCPHQCFHDSLDCRRSMELAVDDFLGSLGEPTNPFAKQDTKGAKDTSDLVLQVTAGSYKLATSGKERPSFVACRRFDMNALAPPRTNDLRQADGVVAIRLGRHHL